MEVELVGNPLRHQIVRQPEHVLLLQQAAHVQELLLDVRGRQVVHDEVESIDEPLRGRNRRRDGLHAGHDLRNVKLRGRRRGGQGWRRPRRGRDCRLGQRRRSGGIACQMRRRAQRGAVQLDAKRSGGATGAIRLPGLADGLLDELDQLRILRLEMRDRHHMRAVLRPLGEPRLELLQGDEAEEEHLGRRAVHVVGRLLAQRFQHVSQRHAQRHVGHQVVLNHLTEQGRRDAQLLLGILVEVLVLAEDVLHHASEDVLVMLVAGVLEPLHEAHGVRHLDLPIVHLLVVHAGFLFDLLALQLHHPREALGRLLRDEAQLLSQHRRLAQHLGRLRHLQRHVQALETERSPLRAALRSHVGQLPLTKIQKESQEGLPIGVDALGQPLGHVELALVSLDRRQRQ
mmetsp:Transcript_1979/g.8733  ORF Transcript_1979/g.8733 Transcript_1979/m.8733 type:complete len:400 (-) Transcript_1979:1863-3062(-)